MPVFGCLVTVEFNHEMDGLITGVGGSEIVFVVATHTVAAKKLGNAKVHDMIEEWDGVTDLKTAVERIREVPFWAMLSKKEPYYWRLDEGDPEQAKSAAIQKTKKSNRYFS